MIEIMKKDKEKVFKTIHPSKMDTAGLTLPALAGSAMLAMKPHGFLEPFNEVFKDKHSVNLYIASDILITLAIIAKLKQKECMGL